MDDWLISFILFIIVFFLYFHIQQQYKTSDVLEIYETDYTNNKSLQQTCTLRQPVLFLLNTPGLTYDNIKDLQINTNVRDNRDFYNNDIDFVEPIILKTQSALGLLDSDTKSIYFSDCNDIYFKNDSLIEKVELLDSLLQPTFTSIKNYDVMFGSRKAYTPMTYHTYSERFILVSGENSQSGIRIKMCPWKNTPLLDSKKNYEHYEFWSRKNMFRGDDESFKILDFIVNPGYVLYIPPYWWYSIQFLHKSTCVTVLTYSTPVNILSNCKNYGLYFYYQHHLHSQIVNKLIPDIEDLDENTPDKKNLVDNVFKCENTEELNLDQKYEKLVDKDISLQLIDELRISKSNV